MKIYIVARVTEDSYIQVDSCYLEYDEADKKANELMEENDDEWEVISSSF